MHKDPERARAYRAAYYQKNKERLKEQKRAWAAANPEKMKAYGKAWRERNPEKVRAAKRKFLAENPDYESKQQREWIKANPEYNRARQAMRRRGGARPTGEALQYARIVRHDPCSYCGDRGGTIDHVFALKDGGDSEWENLAGACHSCNSRKGARRPLHHLLRVQVDLGGPEAVDSTATEE